MPALNNTQLSILRTKPQTSNFYLFPVLPQIAFQAQINDPAITVGAVVITYDNVTLGTFGGILAGMTLWVGSAPGLYNVARIRIRGANATTITVAENSDIPWVDNLYLTVIFQWLPWAVRPRITGGVVYKDYNIAYTDQTDKWPPVSMMGDPAIKFFDSSPTNVYFDGSESYAVAQGATITGHYWDFGDGTNSAVATPGNHPYFVTGQYWPLHQVTDSNGKTHVTYRPVCIIDRTSAYVNFRCDSMSGSIDAGWVAKFTVFGNAPLSAFPERAPIFFFSDDTFGSNAGSVGFPNGRENVIMFGYIQEDSVTKNPETGDITFDVAGIARAMERISMYPATTQDKATPAAWTEAKNLNIFRSFVFLLKFHTTVMDVADVFLYNDTTPIRVTNFPEDNLWNMFAQFAKGARLMRVGATRTGRVVLGRDPNLMTIPNRATVPVVMQIAQGDWVGQVTMPEQPYPLCAYLCLGGLTYDAIPAHESNPLFGMSPGRPNKEFGDSREIHFLQLLSQTEVNTLAGLALGQINNAFGDVVVEMAGNWTRAFDPALQEYIQAPSSGWVSKRGTLLSNQYLIVRKVEFKFNWPGGYVNCSLTCEVYSYQEIGVNGDCFTTDAPLPPIVVIPPIVVNPPILLTEAPVMLSPSSACVLGLSYIYLSWTYGGIGTPTFYIEHSFSPSIGWTVLDTTTGTTYSDPFETVGRTIYFRVRGNIGGFYTPYSNVVSQVDDFCPITLSLTQPDCITNDLSWNAIAGPTSYSVERSSVGGGVGFSAIASIPPPAGLTVTYSDVPPSRGTWYYRVRGQNAYGSSAYSNEVNGVSGPEAWHNHVIYATTNKVYEWNGFTFGIGYAPVPTDITGNILGNILGFQVAGDGSVLVLSDYAPSSHSFNTLWKRTGTATWAQGNSAEEWAGVQGGNGSGVWSHNWFPAEDGTGFHGNAWWGCRGVCTTGTFPCDTPHVVDNDPCIHWSYLANNAYLSVIGDQMLVYATLGTVLSDCSTLSDGVYKATVSAGGVAKLGCGNFSDDGVPPNWVDQGFAVLFPFIVPKHFTPYLVETLHSFLSEQHLLNSHLWFDGTDYAINVAAPFHYTDESGFIWAWYDGYLRKSGGVGGNPLTEVDLLAHRFLGAFSLNIPQGQSSVARIMGRDGGGGATYNMYKTIDGGTTWTTHPSPARGSFSTRNGGANIFTAPSEPNRLYVTDESGSLWVSNDEGTHWCLVFDIAYPGEASVGMWVDTSS